MFLFKKLLFQAIIDLQEITEIVQRVSSMLTSYIIMVKYQNLETLLVIKNVLLSLL